MLLIERKKQYAIWIYRILEAQNIDRRKTDTDYRNRQTCRHKLQTLKQTKKYKGRQRQTKKDKKQRKIKIDVPWST